MNRHTLTNRESFRALRETVGMSRSLLADILGVNEKSVTRWEKPNDEGYYTAPADAWAVLHRARADQIRSVNAIVSACGETEEPCSLVYWLTESDYAAHNPNNDPRSWAMENANARIAAVILTRAGRTVQFTGHIQPKV